MSLIALFYQYFIYLLFEDSFELHVHKLIYVKFYNHAFNPVFRGLVPLLLRLWNCVYADNYDKKN